MRRKEVVIIPLVVYAINLVMKAMTLHMEVLLESKGCNQVKEYDDGIKSCNLTKMYLHISIYEVTIREKRGVECFTNWNNRITRIFKFFYGNVGHKVARRPPGSTRRISFPSY